MLALTVYEGGLSGDGSISGSRLAVILSGSEGAKEAGTSVDELDGVEAAVEAATVLVMPGGGGLTMVFGGRGAVTVTEGVVVTAVREIGASMIGG